MTADTLADIQRAALRIAEREGWSVVVEAGDGSQARLRPGRPGKTLVISLSPDAATRRAA